MTEEMQTNIQETYVVVYAGSSLMYSGSQDDCNTFVEQGRKRFPYVNDWRVMDVEDFGQMMYDRGYDNGYDCGSNIL